MVSFHLIVCQDKSLTFHDWFSSLQVSDDDSYISDVSDSISMDTCSNEGNSERQNSGMREGLKLRINMRLYLHIWPFVARSLRCLWSFSHPGHWCFSLYLQSSQQRGDAGAPPLHTPLPQTQQQREPLEHLEEQYRKGSVQGGHAGTAQWAHQHPPEAVWRAGVQWATGHRQPDPRPLPTDGEWRNLWMHTLSYV